MAIGIIIPKGLKVCKKRLSLQSATPWESNNNDLYLIFQTCDTFGIKNQQNYCKVFKKRNFILSVICGFA
jgi:hypothetical protein